MLSGTKSWFFWFLGALILPFALVILSYQLAALVPGTVKVSLWEATSTGFFLFSIASTLTVVVRSPLRWLARTSLGSLTVLVLLLAAFTMSVHSTCEERPTYIGKRVTPQVVGSCP
jgi:hypothetical protein